MKLIARNAEDKRAYDLATELLSGHFDIDFSRVKEVRIQKRFSKADLPAGALGCCKGGYVSIHGVGSQSQSFGTVNFKTLVNVIMHELIHVWQEQNEAFADTDDWTEDHDGYRNKGNEIHARFAAGYLIAVQELKDGECSQALFDKCFREEHLSVEWAKARSLAKR